MISMRNKRHLRNIILCEHTLIFRYNIYIGDTEWVVYEKRKWITNRSQSIAHHQETMNGRRWNFGLLQSFDTKSIHESQLHTFLQTMIVKCNTLVQHCCTLYACMSHCVEYTSFHEDYPTCNIRGSMKQDQFLSWQCPTCFLQMPSTLVSAYW